MVSTDPTSGTPYLRKLGNFLKAIVCPPAKATDAGGYGETIAERYPSMSRQAIKHISRQHPGILTLIFISILTGFVTGIAAHLLKTGIGSLSSLLTAAFNPAKGNVWLILLPLAGIVLTGIFQRYVIHRAIYNGEDRLCDDFLRNRCYLPVSLTYTPLLASTVTLGFGGSAGSEGPIAYSGAALGSNIAAWFRLPPRHVRTLMAIGAGAGIAGIFKAPVGGVLFTIELHKLTMSSLSVVGLFAACVTSALTAFLMSGDTFDVPFPSPVTIDLTLVPILILLGVFCGLYSVYYSAVMQKIKKLCYTVRNPWLRNIGAGLTVGFLVFLFPPLYGEGYGIVGELLSGNWAHIAAGSCFTDGYLSLEEGAGVLPLLLIPLGIILTKAFATSATNSGGGVAGDFAPTLMAGSVAGFLFAATLNHLCGTDIPVADCVFFGMAGVMAGAIRAPLMSIFIVTEMATSGYGLLLPVTVVAITSYTAVCSVSYLTRILRVRSPRTSR